MPALKREKKEKMSFARHETFYIRDGWLRKGIKLVNERGLNFLKHKDAPEVLGMGKNMVQSLRFWLHATKLVEQNKTNNNEFIISQYGRIVYDLDTYFEDNGTLWLIHYHLVTNKEHATTWYWFFNIFNHREFDDATFLYWLNNYAIIEGSRAAESSFKKDYQCFINTYLHEKRLRKNNSPEDNINCPLRNLKLLRKTGAKTYKCNNVNRKSLHPLIVFYVIKKWQEDMDRPLQITITDIVEASCNVGKVFNLSYAEVNYYLEECQELGLLTVSRTAGLDSVTLKEITPPQVLTRYYHEATGGETGA